MGSRGQNIPTSGYLKPTSDPGLLSTNHYHDLLQLEPAEDLIQLHSRPPTPHVEPDQVDRTLVATTEDTANNRLESYVFAKESC